MTCLHLPHQEFSSTPLTGTFTVRVRSMDFQAITPYPFMLLSSYTHYFAMSKNNIAYRWLHNNELTERSKSAMPEMIEQAKKVIESISKNKSALIMLLQERAETVESQKALKSIARKMNKAVAKEMDAFIHSEGVDRLGECAQALKNKLTQSTAQLKSLAIERYRIISDFDVRVSELLGFSDLAFSTIIDYEKFLETLVDESPEAIV